MSATFYLRVLVSLAASFQRDTVTGPLAAERIYETIEELRLIVDGLDATGEPLGIALGTFRQRLRERLADAEIATEWHLDATLEQQVISPDTQLCLLRILQECTANILRHSAARHARFDIRSSPTGNLVATVSDDGCGMPDKNSMGRGLANMRRRIETLDGNMAVNARSPETELRFSIPLAEQKS